MALGWEATDAGVFLGVGALPGLVVCPLSGVLANRYGRRRVLAGALALVGTAGGLSAAAETAEVLVLLRFVQGLGAAGLINLVTS